MEPNLRERRPSRFEEIDLFEMLFVLRDKIAYIIICALLGGALAYGHTARTAVPLYQASIKMIVNSRREAYTTLSVGDVTSAESLVATYAAVIKSNRVLDRVIEAMQLNMSWTTLNNMVSVNPVSGTPVINLVVTSSDPEQARAIVTTISEVAPELIVDAVEAGSCKVISDAYCSGSPISPNIRRVTMQGLIVGGAASSALFILLHLLNDTVQSEEMLEQLTGAPVLSAVPLAGGKKHKGRHGRHGKRRRKKT